MKLNCYSSYQDRTDVKYVLHLTFKTQLSLHFDPVTFFKFKTFDFFFKNEFIFFSIIIGINGYYLPKER